MLVFPSSSVIFTEIFLTEPFEYVNWTAWWVFCGSLPFLASLWIWKSGKSFSISRQSNLFWSVNESWKTHKKACKWKRQLKTCWIFMFLCFLFEIFYLFHICSQYTKRKFQPNLFSVYSSHCYPRFILAYKQRKTSLSCSKKLFRKKLVWKFSQIFYWFSERDNSSTASLT